MTLTRNRVQMKDVKITKVFKAQDVYDAATCPVASVSHWIKVVQPIGDFGAIEISYIDDMSDDFRKVVLTPDQIGSAFAKLVELNFTHCAGYAIEDLDNSDACTADLVLQMAIYGEIVWG